MDTTVDQQIQQLVGMSIKEVKPHMSECGELQALILIAADGQQIMITAPRSHDLQVFSC